MEPYKRVPSPRIVRRRPSAVSTSLLSTSALDVDLHLALARPLPDVVTATITYAAPHHLVADDGIASHRPWRGPGEGAAAAAPKPLLSIGPRPA